MDRYKISERPACSLVGLSRTVYRYMPIPRDDEEPFRVEVIRLACTYGYRTVAALMRNAGWQRATEEQVKRIWQQEDLKVPDKQTPKGRFGLMMAVVCAYEPSIQTMSGATTLCLFEMSMEGKSGCSP